MSATADAPKAPSTPASSTPVRAEGSDSGERLLTEPARVLTLIYLQYPVWPRGTRSLHDRLA